MSTIPTELTNASRSKSMRVGTKITVTFSRPEGDVQESAKVARTMGYMLPLPDGYVPVRFDSGVLMVHVSAIQEAA